MAAKKKTRIGRYDLFGAIASGGMATVHIARLRGPIGFSRVVAIKQLHPRFARDPNVYDMLVDEARLAGRIQHPNALATSDVVSEDNQLYLVMDYVAGESLNRVLKTLRATEELMPVSIAVAIIGSVLSGLHAAHEAKSSKGEPLDIVHRDVSPQNILVGSDGVTRVIDFGIAKATERIQKSTVSGQIKGKLAYMAPEQIAGDHVDRRTDVWSATVVLWEALCGKRLFGNDPGTILAMMAKGEIPAVRSVRSDVPEALEEVVQTGLAKDPEGRFATAREMAHALEHAVSPATAREVGDFLERHLGDVLAKRAEQIGALERDLVDEPSTAPSSDPAPIVAQPPPPPSTDAPIAKAPPRSRFAPWSIVGLLAIGVGIIAALFGDTPKPPPQGAASTATAPMDSPAPSASNPREPPPASEASAPSSSAPDPNAIASSSASAAAASAAAPTAPPPAPLQAPPPAPQPPPPPSVDPCTVPFVFVKENDKLIKKWKPECL